MGNEISMHIKGQVQRNATTLLALSTVAMGGVEPGTMVVAARDDGNTFLHDLTKVFDEDGRFTFHPGRTPYEKVNTAAARDHFNREPTEHGREVDPNRHIELVYRPIQLHSGEARQRWPR